MGVQVPCRFHAEVPQEGAVFDQDRAERGAESAQLSWPQVLGQGYFVSTVGRDEQMIRSYIKNQEMAGQQFDQLQFRLGSSDRMSNLLSQRPS
jgi:hypothetical protein